LSTDSKVMIIDPVKDPQWDPFVLEHPYGLICHTSKWKTVLEKSFPHMKGHYFVIKDASSQITAALPIYVVKSWLLGTRLVSIPFATISDLLISDEDDFNKLWHSVLDYSNSVRTKNIELKTLFSSQMIKDDHLDRVSYYKHHYLEIDRKPIELKKKFHKKSVKSAINKALKSNLRINRKNGRQELDTFYKLYLITRKRLKLPPQPYAFFKAIWETFPENFQILLSYHDKQPVSGLAFFKFKERVSTEFAGWDTDCHGSKPNHLLYWEAIKIAGDEGFKIFDFGRTSPNNIGLMNFKRRWGTKEMDLPCYYRSDKKETVQVKENSKGYRATQSICSILPTPVFKMLGNFCYRHLG